MTHKCEFLCFSFKEAKITIKNKMEQKRKQLISLVSAQNFLDDQFFLDETRWESSRKDLTILTLLFLLYGPKNKITN